MNFWYKMRILLFCLLSFILIVCINISCTSTLTLEKQFQAELDSLQAKFKFPGATAAYILNDGTVKSFAVGLSDIELETPMNPESRMLAASIGKTFVGATILALVNEGVLNVDDPISKWLSNYSWFSHLPNYESTTIRHLLNHTSGIPNHVDEEEFLLNFQKNWSSSSNPFHPESLIKFVLDKPPLFKAGKGWYYTDTGYLLLGLIIEKATETNYYEEVNRRFLKPLNLTLTTPSNKVELPGLASGYMSKENPLGLPPKTTSAPGIMVWHPGVEWTGGGFISNSKDLVLWANALFNGKAIQGDYLENLLQSVPIDANDTLVQYGTAIAIHSGGEFGKQYGHGGWIPGYSSSLRYYPEYGVGIAFQINTDIGIVDHSTDIVEQMETRLAEIVISTVQK